MNICLLSRLATAALLCTAYLITPAHAAPNVVTTIKPLHGLIAAVMEGAGEPSVLIKGNASPHTYSMKPSDAQALQEADVVFWVGDSLETFMVKPLETLPKSARIVTLLDEKGLEFYPYRQWEEEGELEHHHNHTHDDHDHHHDHTGNDSHIWLSHHNAIAITRRAASILGDMDPANAARYKVNASRAINNLRSQKEALHTLLEPVEDRPFMVFHDAYQYFERQNHLTNMGAIHLNPEVAPSAGHLRLLRKKIIDNNVACVLSEPQFSAKLVTTLIEGTGARSAEIDPLGAYIPAGPRHYLETLDQLAQTLAHCLR